MLKVFSEKKTKKNNIFVDFLKPFQDQGLVFSIWIVEGRGQITRQAYILTFLVKYMLGTDSYTNTHHIFT